MIPIFIVCMLFVLAMTSLNYAKGGSQGLWQAHWAMRRKSNDT